MKILIIIILILNIRIIGKIINVILPFILSSFLVYIFYPLYCKLDKIPKIIRIILIISIIILISFFIILFIYLFKDKIIDFIKWIIIFINNISNKYNIDLSIIISYLSKILDYKYIIHGINFISNFILFIFSFIYIFLDIDRIVLIIRRLKIYDLLIDIDNNIRYYLLSLIKISIISLFEYGLGFYIIGHSNYILLGIIASITNLIPYIGSIMVLISSIILDMNNIVKISILYVILGLIDSYIINPYIYGKYNSINPIISLISISIFSYLFGIIGIILSIPLIIIIKCILKYIDIDKYLNKLFKK